ncbi:restriction endonuclease subunit S [Hymenobacter psychrophilus]|nr:restriction endonuclease subunit S [Hymenobacter psychrophilus]
MNEEQELPKGWEWTTLPVLSDNLDSRRVPINNSERNERIAGKVEKELVPYYGATGQVGYIDKPLFDEELLLLGEDAAPFYDPAKPVAYLIQGKSWVNNHAHILRAKPATTNRFLLHYLNSFDYHGYVTGTTRLKLTQQSMNTIPLPLPPLAEQGRIVAKLEELFSRLDAGVAAVRQSQQLLKRYRQSVLHAAVTGALTSAWRTAHPAPAETGAALLARIRAEKEHLVKAGKLRKEKQLPDVDDNEKPFPLPDGWSWFRMGNILLKLTDGTHHSPINTEKGDFKYITAKNIKQSGIKLSKLTFVNKETHDEIYSRCNPELGDVLYIKDGATTGIAAINMLAEPFSMLSSVALLKCSKEIINKYLHSVLSSSYFYNVMRDDMSGVAITRVTLKKLANALVQLPPLAEQAEIVAEVERRLSTIDALEQTLAAELKRAERLRQSLLHRAFTGRLVPQDATDEPAGELLARLREAAAPGPAKAKASRAKAAAAPVAGDAGEGKRRGRPRKGVADGAVAEVAETPLPVGTQTTLGF